MKVSSVERKINIINNIEYILRSRGETKASFSQRTGVTRATLYKILDGKVSNVQHTTVTRIADFFGVNCEIIENSSLENLEKSEREISIEGDKNPAAIPIIPQSEILACLDKRVGLMVTQYPVTWFFGDVSNMLALKIEKEFGYGFSIGDLLIFRRYSKVEKKQMMLWYSPPDRFSLTNYLDGSNTLHHADALFLGTVVEERMHL
ncbi:helix-turn-helix transcriptional regulator [Rouxiella sp. T17]|uniref:helix-turn-helix domain-containing protein n=1 Tax=Rouxiella sp. T17 TaxID=3085684 RepID=UPI002FCAC16F